MITEIKTKDWKYFDDLRKNGNKRKKDLVQKIVPRNSLILDYGGPKCGKSLYELMKCISMSRGLKFLNKFKTTKTNPLYIDLENSENTINEREYSIKKFMKIRKHNVVFITRESPVNILNKEFVDELKAIIKEKQIGYIVIDTLPKSASYDCKEERDVNNLYISFFKPLIDEFDISICFLLHTTKKGDSFLGSQAYKGCVDCCYEFKKVYGKGNTIQTNIYSDNRGVNVNFGVKFVFDTIEDKDGNSSLKGINIEYYETEERRAGERSTKQTETRDIKLVNDIKSLFKEDSKLQKSDVIKGLSDLGYDEKRLLELDSTIKRILSWFCSQGILTKQGNGKSTYYKLKIKEVMEIAA